jgi:tRNA nucleotidyltransferase (CCA-adding enzyme)
VSQNVHSLMQHRLSARSLALMEKAGELAAERRLDLYLVGGVVRDILLGRDSSDLDLVVEGDAIGLAEALAKEVGGKLVVHRRFGTAKIRSGSLTVDVAMARTEKYARPGALPAVRPGSILDDLVRRDFTINAMALRLSPDGPGELVDPCGGRQDLQARAIRMLHERSFIDDATRMLRAVRYEQRFGFRLEIITERLLRRHVSQLGTVSGDRIRHEVDLILHEGRPEKVLLRAGELGLLAQIHPSLTVDGRLESMFEQARQVAPAPATALGYALMTRSLSVGESEDFTARLRTPRAVSSAILDSARLRERMPSLDEPGLAPSAVCELLRECSPASILAGAIGADSALVRERLDLYRTRWRHVRTALDGADLLKMGVPSGRRLGLTLKALHDARLDGKIESREDEIALVQRWLPRGR